MENNRFSADSNALSVASINTIRNSLNPRGPKQRTPPALKKALELLKFKDLDGLENHFLGMTAFLKPWCRFRDAFLLLGPNSMPRSSEPDRVRGMDILWFYTNFSEGELRYDARADDDTSLFTTDETQYGTFDTTHWGVEEHEKMMYAWLLQEFKVGKARNPFGFQYFELQNVCTAWKTVFVPIVEAVRDSYDPRGRRHYGRLAKLIEERHPSRLAFPEYNVTVPQSANPYRMVSVPREHGIVVTAERLTGNSSLTGSTLSRAAKKKQEVVLEKELRDIYPKYGQVVEKPKGNLAEFLANQKARIKRKNREIQEGVLFSRNTSGKESPFFGCKGIDDPRVLDPVVDANRRSASMGGRSSFEVPPSPRSPSKRSPKKHFMVPFGMYGFVPSPKEDKAEKSPLHGVTRRLSLTHPASEGEDTQDMIIHLKMAERENQATDNLEYLPKANHAQESADSASVYSSIRNSNPFVEDTSDFGSTPEHHTSIEVLSPMSGHPSAIPKPLMFNSTRRHNSGSRNDLKLVHDSQTPSIVRSASKPPRMPSYAGTGYDREIERPFVATGSHSTLEHGAYDHLARESSSTILEHPEDIYPYERHYQPTAAPKPYTPSKNPGTSRVPEAQDRDIPQNVPWCGMTPAFPPEPLAWPGQTPTATSAASTVWPRASQFDNAEPPPPIPPKHPARTASIRSSAGSDLPPPSIPQLLGPRIVSKENIRGHLSNISRDISEESVRQTKQRDVTPTGPVRLTPYNKNLFPRRDRNGTPVGAWFERKQSESVDGVEMEPLKKGDVKE